MKYNNKIGVLKNIPFENETFVVVEITLNPHSFWPLGVLLLFLKGTYSPSLNMALYFYLLKILLISLFLMLFFRL